MKTEFTAQGTLELEGYVPSRPAPACSNPSSPLFSDPGDAADYERAEAVIIVGNREIILTEDQAEAIYEALELSIERDFIDSVTQF